MDHIQAARYLDLLGLAVQPPGLAALTRLVTAHLGRIPFENISKLRQFGRGGPPERTPLDQYLDNIEYLNLGGTCSTCSGHFHSLLRLLGYQVSLCGAAMERPDVHVVNLVHLDGHDYLVDVGYAAPFFAPVLLPSDRPTMVACGDDEYLVHPRDASGHTRVDHRRGGERVHGYRVNPTPREAPHFHATVADSFRPTSEFLNCLRVVRQRPEQTIDVKDFRVTVRTGTAVRRRVLPSPEALADVVAVLLKIPPEVTAEALSVLTRQRSRRED